MEKPGLDRINPAFQGLSPRLIIACKRSVGLTGTAVEFLERKL